MLAAASLSSSTVFRGGLQRRGALIVYGMSRLKTVVIGIGHDEMSEISDSKSGLYCEVRQQEVATKTLLFCRVQSDEVGAHVRRVGRPGDYHHNTETSNNLSPERPLRLLISQKGRKQYSQQSATET